jgi:hypothetical protein
MTALRVSAGPLLWLAHFTLLYGFNSIACARGFEGAVPWAVGFATVILGVAAALLVFLPRKDFVNWLSAALAALSLLAILWQALPALMVSPCA